MKLLRFTLPFLYLLIFTQVLAESRPESMDLNDDSLRETSALHSPAPKNIYFILPRKNRMSLSPKC